MKDRQATSEKITKESFVKLQSQDSEPLDNKLDIEPAITVPVQTVCENLDMNLIQIQIVKPDIEEEKKENLVQIEVEKAEARPQLQKKYLIEYGIYNKNSINLREVNMRDIRPNEMIQIIETGDDYPENARPEDLPENVKIKRIFFAIIIIIVIVVVVALVSTRL